MNATAHTMISRNCLALPILSPLLHASDVNARVRKGGRWPALASGHKSRSWFSLRHGFTRVVHAGRSQAQAEAGRSRRSGPTIYGSTAQGEHHLANQMLWAAFGFHLQLVKKYGDVVQLALAVPVRVPSVCLT